MNRFSAPDIRRTAPAAGRRGPGPDLCRADPAARWVVCGAQPPGGSALLGGPGVLLR